MQLKELVNGLAKLDGVLAVGIVDYNKNKLLASAYNNCSYNLEAVALGGSEVIRAKLATVESLNMDDSINDILITLTTQYHLICPSKNQRHLFIYMAVERDKANLSRCRTAMFHAESLIPSLED
ncbi:hypothetical protein ACKLNO_04385 [Neisseriaceae bacterium B1]